MSLAPADEPKTAPTEQGTGGRPHLVVVRTRPIDRTQDADAPNGAVILTWFWHPRDRVWSRNYFESLEHALRLFVDESGWRLLQQQPLDAPHQNEIIFEARRADFARPSTEDLLREIGMTPTSVARLLDRPDRDTPKGTEDHV